MYMPSKMWSREDKFKFRNVYAFWNVKHRNGDQRVFMVQILSIWIEKSGQSGQCNHHYLEKWKT